MRVDLDIFQTLLNRRPGTRKLPPVPEAR